MFNIWLNIKYLYYHICLCIHSVRIWIFLLVVGFFFGLRTYEILSSHKHGKGMGKTFQIIVAILFAAKLYFVVFVVVVLSLLSYVTSQMQFLLPSSPQSPPQPLPTTPKFPSPPDRPHEDLLSDKNRPPRDIAQTQHNKLQ